MRDSSHVRELPRGTVTLLFTDIEGSTRLLHRLGRDEYVQVLEQHRRLLREAFAEHGGTEVDEQGDSFFFAFPYARDAVAAAAAAQRALAAHDWRDAVVRVRMGLHTGEPIISAGRYAGLDVHRAARVMSVAHGGQVILSGRTTDFVRNELPAGLSLRKLGSFFLKDFDGGEPLAQLDVEGLPSTFPKLRAERAPSRIMKLTPRPVRRHPWVAGGLAIVVALGAALPLSLIGPARVRFQANALAELNARTGKAVGVVPVGDTPTAVAPSESGNALWIANSGDATVSRVDTRQARVVRTIPMPGTPVGLVKAADSVWVVNSDLAAAHSTLSRIDLQYQRVASTIQLPSTILIGSGAGITWDGRDVWAVTQAGSAFRVSPASNRITARVPVGDDPTSVVATGRTIWVANRRDATVSRIEPPGAVTATVRVGAVPSAIAEGGGSVWVADAGENAVRRIDARTGSVLTTIKVGKGPSAIAASANDVWVSNSGEQTVMRIDPRTNRVSKTVAVGYQPGALAITDGRVWIALQQLPAPQTQAAGGTARVVTFEPGAVDSADPPLAYTIVTWQIEYATCAKLFNYPDAPLPEGYRLRPEIAAAMPNVSPDGRTYTITVRRGFRFSPPSSQEVTARTFQYSIERALNPKTKSFAANFAGDFVGADAYRAGRSAHIAGIAVRGNKLVIRLTHPAGDLPARLAMPFFCPVPIGTPTDFKGLAGVPSAGPYYVARYVPGKDLLLRRNPNYHGARPRRLGAIDIRPVPTEDAALNAVEHDRADLVIGTIGASIPQRYRKHFFRDPMPVSHYLALNTSRPLFSDARLRVAVAKVLDRTALSSFDPNLVPSDSLLPPGFPGQESRRAFRLHGQREAVGRPAGRRSLRAVFMTCDKPTCLKRAAVVSAQLKRLGIRVLVQSLPADVLFAKTTAPGAAFDITETGWAMDYVDPGDFLAPIAQEAGIKSAQSTNIAYFRDPGIDRGISRALAEAGAKRLRSFAQIEWSLRTKLVPYVAYASETRPILFSSRLGCHVANPVYYGTDLAALCIRH